MSISIVDIPVSQLEPNPHNPRRDVGDVRELADSIRAQGIKQELLVTPSGDRDGRPMTAWSSGIEGSRPRRLPAWTWCRAAWRSLRRARNAS